MDDRFIQIIDYLESLQLDIVNQELSSDERLLIMIKYALLNDNYHHGSIIFTKEGDDYIVSSIQKYSYAWMLQGEIINIDNIINKLFELGIENKIEYYPISNHKNDYELSFCISKLKKRTR